ncbi:Neurochondrin-domain-containing protein [Podospora fimiseda]|uniref:Neurochondrin-domain-containing protein n=1 Tax=Podospora fimiseda TaxID=252190 RepID=A0AAN7H0H2_9PEZI|nr:Neurochondrin-domain-containing protein [Podospora fimiseda]
MADTILSAEQQAASIQKIQTLLGAKDDTSRFVGLALLKSILDNTPELRSNEEAIVTLWGSISHKFLDRLIRTGSKQQSSKEDAKNMLDLAVSVLHTFATLLPEDARKESKMVDRIPQLVACLLYCSEQTTPLVLETIVSLVNQPSGSQVFIAIDDLSPLTEIAPSQPLALETFFHAWLNAMTLSPNNTVTLQSKIETTIGTLITSFKGTDAITLMNFLAILLPRLSETLLPPNPSWLQQLIKYIQSLVTSRPTVNGREAFTNLSAALLEVYPIQTPPLLFSETSPPEENKQSNLMIQLLLIDIRSTLPTILSLLNSPSYTQIAHRLTSAYNVVSNFIGYLLRTLDSDSPSISPSTLLTLRKSIAETMSLTSEYLRDRWDASVAGAMGLHPDARVEPAAASSSAAHLTLAWDSKCSDRTVGEDPLILAAVRALAIWLREDDGEVLRREASGLVDCFVELYASNGRLDFKRPVLAALEGIVAERKGREAVLTEGGWKVLGEDLAEILHTGEEEAAARGIEIVRVMLSIVEEEEGDTREEWMDLVTKVAWLYVPEDKKVKAATVEFWFAVLQLITAILVGAHSGMRKRYKHSISAVVGISEQLSGKIRGDGELEEALEDVRSTLVDMR